jgi:hypothetical protein
MASLVYALVAVTVVVGATFLPFLSGGHDPLARPLSTMAWVFGRVGLLFVPIGMAWLWASSRHTASAVPPRWLARLTLGACVFVALVMSLVAFSSSGVLLAAGVATLAGQLLVRLARRFRTPIRAIPRMGSALLTLSPIAVLALQIALAEPVSTIGRDRVIANSATLIRALSYRWFDRSSQAINQLVNLVTRSARHRAPEGAQLVDRHLPFTRIEVSEGRIDFRLLSDFQPNPERRQGTA